MQFSRNWWRNYSEFANLNEAKNPFWFLKKCGFTYLDGTEFNTDTGWPEYFGWGKDPYKRVNFWRDSGEIYEYRYHTRTYTDSQCLIFGFESITGLLFFPLKNQGFHLIDYMSDYFDEYRYTVPVQTAWHYPEYRNTGLSLVHNYLGFFNNIDNEFNYISMCRRADIPAQRYSWINSDHDYTKARWDRYYSLVYLDKVADTTGDKVDVKQNVCTMIKVPYENSFLSNLFLITTAPVQGRVNADRNGWDYYPCDSTGLENKFFSFNGRNFYGIYANLAVELPAN